MGKNVANRRKDMMLNIRVSEEDRTFWQACARRRGISISDLVHDALNFACGRKHLTRPVSFETIPPPAKGK